MKIELFSNEDFAKAFPLAVIQSIHKQGIRLTATSHSSVNSNVSIALKQLFLTRIIHILLTGKHHPLLRCKRRSPYPVL